ncbi:unnamed protein product [Calypogeia fissa]
MASVKHPLRSNFSARFQLVLIFPLCFSLLVRVVHAASVNRRDEVQALLSFREQNSIFNDITSMYGIPPPISPYWYAWNATDETPCAWFGVVCTANYTVEELDFSGWGLVLANLTGLSSLPDLRHLDLSSNFALEGSQISRVTQLIRLDLSGTVVIPPLPISACRNLRFLPLDQTNSLNLPDGLSSLVHLQFLNRSGNYLTGTFPTAGLGGLSNLVVLDLSNNDLTGTLPALPNLTNLVELKLDNNSFDGFQGSWFVGTKVLEQLSISNNMLTGTIPSSIPSFLNLRVLDLSHNNLSGSIPFGFTAQNNNYGFALDLSGNKLSGEIPSDLLEQTSTPNYCSSVNLSHNLLTGNIPIDGSTNLYFCVLDLSYNNLSGPIRSDIFSQSQILVLRLQNNQLSGDIVDVLSGPGFFLSVVEARLGNNFFTGDLSRIPKIVSDLGYGGGLTIGLLQVLDLTNNLLQWTTSAAMPDPVQATLSTLTSLAAAAEGLLEFLAGGNNFSGTSLPTACIGKISNVLDLSNSSLHGEILGAAFSSACLSPDILLLNLSNNHATGTLSDDIITGNINPAFVLDVSNNDLSGSLPAIPRTSSMYNWKYFAGNGGLCGDPLPPCRGSPHRHWLQWWVLLVVGGCVTVAMGSCLAAIWQWRVYQIQHQQDEELIRTLQENEVATLMSVRELKKATNNFADSARIGEGGFGNVYKGMLHGTMVAIKRGKQEGSDTNIETYKRQFLKEVRILSQVNHRHLVKLLGCCMANKTALLVLEFVSNGTLEQHLQGKIRSSRLSWKQQLNIAVQTADALNYLHSAATFPIFHGDVKSANILLTEDFDAKVADFGISKLAPIHATHVTTVGGTTGYMDPESFVTHRLTDKSDVYSFGVVLLELISAKPALDHRRPGDNSSLVNLARSFIESANLQEFIDPFLMETYRDPTHAGQESILNVGRLAMQCLDMYSRNRPSMIEVLMELQKFCWAFSRIPGGTVASIEANLDLQLDDQVLLMNYSCPVPVQGASSGIEMSHSSPFGRFRSRLVGFRSRSMG